MELAKCGRRAQMVVSAGILSVVTAAFAAQGRGGSRFASFSGTWTGAGYISTSGGDRERVRCRASYAPQPDRAAMRIFIACASDSYKVQVTSDVEATPDGTVSGTWQEATRQVSGEVSGRVPAPGQLQASLEGTPYGISLSFDTRGRRQAIAIRVDNSDIQSVDVTLQRS